MKTNKNEGAENGKPMGDFSSDDPADWTIYIDPRQYIPAARCPRCKRDVQLKLSSAGPHIRGDCPICGRYIKFVKKGDLEP